MNPVNFPFPSGRTSFYFDTPLTRIRQLVAQRNAVIITDENVFNAHSQKFRNWNTIVLKAGESFKVQQTADAIIDQLIAFEADRSTWLIGVGGGVVTDLTGYVATLYMRGLSFGLVPTSILAMVDAAIGGKNGVDVGVYKNLVGTIRQPAFVLFDPGLLATLPPGEWRSGFAEIIKHACIKDRVMFRELEQYSMEHWQKNRKKLSLLLQRNVKLKARIVMNDESETGDRKLLNFGHTLGHALENLYELSHGEAVSIGMTCAARLSEQFSSFRDTDRLTSLLDQYQLPSYATFNSRKVFSVMKMDKKRQRDHMNFILLERIGKGFVHPIAIKELENLITRLQ